MYFKLLQFSYCKRVSDYNNTMQLLIPLKEALPAIYHYPEI